MTPPTVLPAHSTVRPVRLATGRGAHRDLAALQCAPDDREPLASALLVPGFTGSKEEFFTILEPLAAAGYAATAIDQLGQHESPWGPPEAYAFDELAADVLAVARTLPHPVHLVGHSLGGLVARRAVLADAAAFASLTLMSSGPAGIVGERREALHTLLADLQACDIATLFDRQQAAELAAGLPEKPEQLTAFLRKRALASCPTGLRVTGEQLRDEPDLVDQVRATGVRALVIYGEADNAWPPSLQEHMAARLGAERVVVPGAAHSPAAEAPQTTARELATFWGRAI